jgi:hypothetical protein
MGGVWQLLRVHLLLKDKTHQPYRPHPMKRKFGLIFKIHF